MKSVFKQNRAFFCEPYLLTPEQQKDPISVFHGFFDTLHLEEVRESIAELLEAALTSPTLFSTAKEREGIMYFCERLEQTLEAAWLAKRDHGKPSQAIPLAYRDDNCIPRELTKEEVNEPMLVIDGFFDYMHLPQHRKAQREMLTALTAGNFNALSQDERSDLLHQFQWLEKVVEAVYLLHNRASV